MLSPRITQTGLPSAKCSANAAFAFLIGIVDMSQTELFAVAQQPQEIPGAVAAGDDQDIPDSGVDERLNRIPDQRPVINRQQVFVRDFRQWIQTASKPASQHNSLQITSP